MSRLKVEDAKQRDVGHSKVRLGREVLQELDIGEGAFIELHGKRMTVAIAWPAYAEDEQREIARMDGLLRHNAQVAMNEYVTINKAQVKDSRTIVFSPTDNQLTVDDEFAGFVKRRFKDMPYVEGDMMLLSIFGSAVPFIATTTEPKGPVKIAESTYVQVMSEPIERPKDRQLVHLELHVVNEKID